MPKQNMDFWELLPELRLMNDIFMTCVFEDNIEGVTLVLHIILGRDDLVVKSVTAQKKYTNLYGHSACLDIVAEDTEGRLYNIEVQRNSEGADPRRARYHSSMLDSRLLQRGQDYAQLADSYVIFITETDVLHRGRPLYHIRRCIEEDGTPFSDGSHIFYVNGTYQNEETPLGRLMHDFRCTRPDKMYHPVLAERVRYFKEEGGQGVMRDLYEDFKKAFMEDALAQGREQGRVEGRAEGQAEGREQGRVEGREAGKAEVKENVALRMIRKKIFSIAEIAEISGLREEEVQAIADRMTA